jgi:transcriptional regulator with XRE-family HTH domain
MPSVDSLTRQLLQQLAATVLAARLARRWTQRDLARAARVSQSMIVRVEHGDLDDIKVRTLVRIVAALDIQVDVRLLAPYAPPAPIRDRAHSRCIAYVARRLEVAGFVVATEVEVGGARWRGFVDVLGWHPVEHVLLVIEVKTEIVDVGELERQLGSYERAAWQAARARGWRPRALTAMLLVLATRENDRRLSAERAYFEGGFSLRARDLNGLLERPSRPPPRGVRGLAMIDPASRRRAWLAPAWIDGRRTPARYASRADALAR